MKILILGANGFIGSNTLQYFRKKYPETWGCDVSVPALNDEKFFVLNRNAPQFDKLFLQNSFDVCINASGSGSVPYSFQHPDLDYKLNANNVFEILNAISRFNPRCRFMNFSSAAVYGNPESLPVSEKSRTKPLSPYGFHKLMSEQICAEFYHNKKIKTCSMRVFSAYGAGLRKQLFWDLYQKSKSGSGIELFGTGEETRDFIHMNDVLLAVESILGHSTFEADVINVASGKGTSIRDAAALYLRILGKDMPVRFNNIKKEGDPKQVQADITKIKNCHFTPTVDLEKGLSLYAEWIMKSGS